jgi:hypothetical protein
MPKETSPALSTLSARVLNGYHPTRAEILSMAGSLLSQDETRGQSEGHIMGSFLNVGSINVSEGGGQVVLTGFDGSQITVPVGGNLDLTLAVTEQSAVSPSWVPAGALAWADFKEGVYSAAAGSIATLLDMWDKDYPELDTFDPANVVPGVGFTNDGANLTNAAAADILAGFTVVVMVPDVGFPVQVTAYETDFSFEFYGKLKTLESEMGDYNDLVFDIPTGSGRHEMKLTITPEKISMCVDGGPVFTGTPAIGAALEKISLSAAQSTVERILFLPPQDDAVLPSLSLV